MTTHILAMGGGGFSMTENGAPTVLDRYLLDLSPVKSPLVCFAPTASADSATYINQFLTAYGALGVRTMVLTMWHDLGTSLERLAEADVVLIGAGSTVNLMALFNIHRVDQILKSMATSGKDIVLAGLSAGGACWFEGCVTDTYGDYRAWRGGMGILEGSFCPHFDGEPERVPVYIQAVDSGLLPGGYGVDDGAALHFIDGKLNRVIAEKPGCTAHKIMPCDEPTASGITNETLEAILL